MEHHRDRRRAIYIVCVLEPAMSSSFADSTFDYRSLLPTRSVESSEQISQQQESDENEVCCGYLPDLTWRERLIGCVTCMLAGYILSMGSFWRFRNLLKGDPFVLNATIGNIISLSGSGMCIVVYYRLGTDSFVWTRLGQLLRRPLRTWYKWPARFVNKNIGAVTGT